MFNYITNRFEGYRRLHEYNINEPATVNMLRCILSIPNHLIQLLDSMDLRLYHNTYLG